MATSVVLMAGNCPDHLENTRTREMEMSSSLMMSGSSGVQKQHTTRAGGTGKPGRRKKSKLQSELAQKTTKTPLRGMGVAQLERIRTGLDVERTVKKMTHHHENYINVPPLISHHHVHQQHFSPARAFGMSSSLTNGGSGSGSVGLGGQQYNQTPSLLQFQGFNSGINGGVFQGPPHHVINSSSGGVIGPLFSDETFLSSHDPFAAVGVGSRIRPVGNGNGHSSHEASKELSSIPNNMKWYSEHCGFCQKKFRGSTGETINMCNGEKKMSCGDMIMSPVNGYGNKGNIFNGGNLNYFASHTTPQEVEVLAVHRKGNSRTEAGGGAAGSSVVMEYEFFPGKFGGFIKQEEVLISLKTEAASSVRDHEQASMVGEASSSSAAAAAATSSFCSDQHHHFLDDQNSNSIDLSLKLSSYI